MNYKLTKQLKNHPKHFIHVGGFVFKVASPKKDIILINEIDEKTKNVFVTVDGEKMNLLYLMIENFMPDVKLTQQFKFSLQNETNYMPLNGIIVSDFVSEISDEINNTIVKFNCKQRADGANQRARHFITPIHVAQTLKTHNFKCVYCGCELNLKNWHLDHYIPLSRGGANVFGNIVPACAICNTMKGAINPMEFYKKCCTIADKFMFKPATV